MEAGGVVPGAEVIAVPAGGVQIVDGVIFLAGKPKQPVTRRVGRDVRLKQAAELERVHDVAVGALAGDRVAVVGEHKHHSGC